jgi:hypothetical protein
MPVIDHVDTQLRIVVGVRDQLHFGGRSAGLRVRMFDDVRKCLTDCRQHVLDLGNVDVDGGEKRS